MDIIDGEKKKSHAKISKDIEDQINNKESKLMSNATPTWTRARLTCATRQSSSPLSEVRKNQLTTVTQQLTKLGNIL